MVGHASDGRRVEQLGVVFEMAAQPTPVVKQLERERCPRAREIELDPIGSKIAAVRKCERWAVFAREQCLGNRRQTERLDQILVRQVIEPGRATDRLHAP